ncbi:HsdM family class I SAM-dependent methyltransferase [Campylobacter concisus]
MQFGTQRVSEDTIRQYAANLLNFQDDKNAKSGTGQITTFNELGFDGILKKPDGWYFPHNENDTAIILETKAHEPNSNLSLNLPQLQEYIEIAQTKYNQVVGILYNGNEAIIYKNDKFYREDNELFSKDYYLKLFTQSSIDKPKIYSCTKSINDNLHVNFGINNLKHRMVFTACALVADRKGANLKGLKGRDFATLQSIIISTLENSYSEQKALNLKLDIIKEQFNLISFNYTKNQKAIDSFIDDVVAISGYIKAESWNGEDVMGIFFNEFTRYKGKSEAGQVFTPDHITSLMYRIANVNYKDNVLDACCGSGAFLVKAMNNMINEVGGNFNENAVKKIQNERLFGIEFDKELFALACANMLIHKDGKTNLTHDDARGEVACEWIKSKNITKVLMNPPYENKFGCLTIVKTCLIMWKAVRFAHFYYRVTNLK